MDEICKGCRLLADEFIVIPLVIVGGATLHIVFSINIIVIIITSKYARKFSMFVSSFSIFL